MSFQAQGATLPGFTHHRSHVNGTDLHYVSAGDLGTPMLLVHGFPETWWCFHELMALLAKEHRVFAVDLRGFGDSQIVTAECDSTTFAGDLAELIVHFNVGPVHVVAQDIAGALAVRLAAAHPEAVRSLTAIEMGLPGYGLEKFADVTSGGVWYISFLVAPAVPETYLPGRERDFITGLIAATTPDGAKAIDDRDIDEFVRTYARIGGWNGAVNLYRSMLHEGDAIRGLAEARAVRAPVFAIGASGGPMTAKTMSAFMGRDVPSVALEGVGHYAAMQAPEQVYRAITGFIDDHRK